MEIRRLALPYRMAVAFALTMPVEKGMVRPGIQQLSHFLSWLLL